MYKVRTRLLQDLHSRVEAKLRKDAGRILSDWCENGVPNRVWENMTKNFTSLVQKFNLFEKQDTSTGNEVFVGKHIKLLIIQIDFKLTNYQTGQL